MGRGRHGRRGRRVGRTPGHRVHPRGCRTTLPRTAHLPLPGALHVRPDRYRDKAEIERWKSRDPIERLTARMRELGELGDKDLAELEHQVADEVEQAVEAAERAPEEPVESLLRHVTSASAEVS
ncbi:thiamine pyrophosphate-dependent enzyme [Streptomyces sp. FXJ1.4098]|nr:thiamine pyrophosphate-dependent enzyme [Streptomyces sp. FXJ1.4098]